MNFNPGRWMCLVRLSYVRASHVFRLSSTRYGADQDGGALSVGAAGKVQPADAWQRSLSQAKRPRPSVPQWCPFFSPFVLRVLSFAIHQQMVPAFGHWGCGGIPKKPPFDRPNYTHFGLWAKHLLGESTLVRHPTFQLFGVQETHRIYNQRPG